MNEKERIIRCVEDFLKRRYELRYNVVKGVTEFRVNDLRFKQWSPLTDRDLKSIVVEEMKEGGESWTNDIRNYIEDFARGCPPVTPDGRRLPPLVSRDGGAGTQHQQGLRQLDGAAAHRRTGTVGRRAVRADGATQNRGLLDYHRHPERDEKAHERI